MNNVALQIDPIAGLNFANDTSLRLAAEALRRGARVYLYQPDQMSWAEGRVLAQANELRTLDLAGARYELGPKQQLDLGQMNVIWVRQDPPFDAAYIDSLHLLELLDPRVLVLNDPRGVRDSPEKMLVLRYPQFIPPTLITRDPAAVGAFRQTHHDIILKPLNGNASHGVFHLTPGDENLGSACELLLAASREPLIVQKYLPEVRQGDRRVLLVEGEPLGVFARVPAAGDARSATRTGATVVEATLTTREREVCAALAPELRARGLVFTGIDMIGDYLTEINVTSPAGVPLLERLGGPNIAPAIWDAAEARLRK